MANIKCKSCGKRYSYHQSDLCPHCGAYNRPASRMRVDFDQDGNAELLHEQTFLQQSAAGRQLRTEGVPRRCGPQGAADPRHRGADEKAEAIRRVPSRGRQGAAGRAGLCAFPDPVSGKMVKGKFLWQISSVNPADGGTAIWRATCALIAGRTTGRPAVCGWILIRTATPNC